MMCTFGSRSSRAPFVGATFQKYNTLQEYMKECSGLLCGSVGR